MDFGIFNLMQQRDASTTSRELIRQAVEQTRAAESLGFARAWFAEHHFSNYSLCPSPLMMIGHVAALTRRIRLGTAVVVAPLHAPARLLGEVGLADTLSEGRLDLGIGSGYQLFEFERFAAPFERRREVTLEMLELLERGLGQSRFEYHGDHIDQLPSAINVRCVQTPHPPIWLAAGDDVVNRRAAERGYTPFVSSRFANRAQLEPIRAHIARGFAAAGRDPDRMPLGVLSYGCVSHDRRDVERYVEAARYQQRVSRSLRERREVVRDDYWVEARPFDGEPTTDEIAANILAGDPDTVAERLADMLRTVRPSHMMFYFQVGGYDGAAALRSMELMAERVLPAVARALATPL